MLDERQYKIIIFVQFSSTSSLNRKVNFSFIHFKMLPDCPLQISVSIRIDLFLFWTRNDSYVARWQIYRLIYIHEIKDNYEFSKIRQNIKEKDLIPKYALKNGTVISKSEGQTFYTSQIYIFLDLFPKNSSKIPCSECTLMLMNIAQNTRSCSEFKQNRFCSHTKNLRLPPDICTGWFLRNVFLASKNI